MQALTLCQYRGNNLYRPLDLEAWSAPRLLAGVYAVNSCGQIFPQAETILSVSFHRL